MKAFVPMASKRPTKDAGLISPRTIIARGPMPLTAEQRRWAKFLRFEAHWDFPDVAIAVGRSEADVRHALANARTRRKTEPRVTVNVSPAAGAVFRAAALPDEPMWETVNRVLGI